VQTGARVGGAPNLLDGRLRARLYVFGRVRVARGFDATSPACS
jgi:hypothetical protein